MQNVHLFLECLVFNIVLFTCVFLLFCLYMSAELGALHLVVIVLFRTLICSLAQQACFCLLFNSQLDKMDKFKL